MNPKWETEVRKTLKIIAVGEAVAEVRILNTSKGTVSGYFDDMEVLLRSIRPYRNNANVYITLNPVLPELLARASNRLIPYAKTTTTDSEITRISRILVDLDPVRPSGISATKAERSAARKLSNQVVESLQEFGFPEPVMASSGNGYHLIFSTDLPNTPENVRDVKAFLNSLDALFSTTEATVDCSTFNPARIVRLHGTRACKGDHTEERPHRISKIISIPERHEKLSLENLQTFVRTVKREPEMHLRDADIDPAAGVSTFLEEKGISIRSSALCSDGKKFILEVCPWNPDHTNGSAFVIQFGNGKVAAGCLHNSCRSQNWKTLLQKLGVPNGDKKTQSLTLENGKEAKQADQLVNLAEKGAYLLSTHGESLVKFQIKGIVELMPVRSVRFRHALTSLFVKEFKTAPSSDALKQALGVLDARPQFDEIQHVVERRVGMCNGSIFYDLCTSKWETVEIAPTGCAIVSPSPVLFIRGKGNGEQVVPDFSVAPKKLKKLLKKHIRVRTEEDRLLMTVYLITCFVPGIAHPVLVLHGEKGSAKSTTLRHLKNIVDPSNYDLLSLPTSKQELAITLSNNFMPAFDNLDTLSQEKSDLLCMASTGGTFVKRTLYTDSEETALSFKRCVALNGINVVATKPDLLDRALLIELERIPAGERRSEKEIFENFDEDRAAILGAAMNTVAAALKERDRVCLSEVGRMADFSYWGYAVAEVLGYGGQAFLDAYLANQTAANITALDSHPVASAVVKLMAFRKKWSGSITELLHALIEISMSGGIDTTAKDWPRDAHVLSRRLNEIKSNIESVGISYEHRHRGGFKSATFRHTDPNWAPPKPKQQPKRKKVTDDDMEDF